MRSAHIKAGLPCLCALSVREVPVKVMLQPVNEEGLDCRRRLGQRLGADEWHIAVCFACGNEEGRQRLLCGGIEREAGCI